MYSPLPLPTHLHHEGYAESWLKSGGTLVATASYENTLPTWYDYASTTTFPEWMMVIDDTIAAWAGDQMDVRNRVVEKELRWEVGR